jgi:hypothetical protein
LGLRDPQIQRFEGLGGGVDLLMKQAGLSGFTLGGRKMLELAVEAEAEELLAVLGSCEFGGSSGEE